MTFILLTLVGANLISAQDCSDQREYCISDCDCERGCGIFSVGGDWLYWKVEQEKMEIGAAISATDTNVNSTVLRPEFEYSTGYRIFADYTTPDQYWKVEASFTHSPTSAGFNQIGGPENIVVFNTNFPLLTAVAENTFTSLNSRWHADVNYLDLDFSRRYSLCKSFEIKPHLGIRGLWIHQDLSIAGTGVVSFTSIMKDRLKGIGVEGGLWGAWNFASGFFLTGHLGGSALYAHSHRSGTIVGVVDDTASNVTYKDKNYFSMPSIDSFAGLAYRTRCRNCSVDLQVGWELHNFLNVNHFSVSDAGDMTLQGLTFGGCVSY